LIKQDVAAADPEFPEFSIQTTSSVTTASNSTWAGEIFPGFRSITPTLSPTQKSSRTRLYSI
jgi:hypothetical protein